MGINTFSSPSVTSSHSGMVKFSEYDEDCEVVPGKLKRYAELVPAVIRGRWTDDNEANSALCTQPAFTKFTPYVALDPQDSSQQLLNSRLYLIVVLDEPFTDLLSSFLPPRTILHIVLFGVSVL